MTCLPSTPEALKAAIAARLRPSASVSPTVAEESLQLHLNAIELSRIRVTAEILPPPSQSNGHIVDIGGTVFWIPVYQMLGYKRVTVLGRDGGGFFAWFQVLPDSSGLVVENVEADAELDPYPIESESVRCAVCFELLEHFAGDPMHLFAETNRILSPGGRMCLATPNVLFYDNIVSILSGSHPFSWSCFTCTYADRHNREYTPFEVRRLFACGGFREEALYTSEIYNHGRLRRFVGYAMSLPGAVTGRVPLALRREKILARAVKERSVANRYPEGFYNLYGRAGVRVPRQLAGRSELQ